MPRRLSCLGRLTVRISSLQVYMSLLHGAADDTDVHLGFSQGTDAPYLRPAVLLASRTRAFGPSLSEHLPHMAGRAARATASASTVTTRRTSTGCARR